MMDFFEKLNFTSSNEDGRSELAALAGARRILCLTGSGTRPLDMLLSGADEVIALDLNPAQNALLRLKIAAFESFTHAEMLAFVGILPSRDRLALYRRLRPRLSPEMAAFWDGRRRPVARGIWYGGTWEKVLRLGALGNRMLRGRAIAALFAAPSLDAQAEIWRARFDDRLWRGCIRLLGRRWIWTRVIGEPGGAFLPGPDEVEARLAGAFTRASRSFFFRQSDFASLILRGSNGLPEALPLHLMPEHYQTIRAALSRLTVKQGGLTDIGLTGIDGFSLSDFGSYCDAAAYAACWAGIRTTAAPGAAFCERVFMNDLPLPEAGLAFDAGLSERLTRADRAIIYQIRAGRITASRHG